MMESAQNHSTDYVRFIVLGAPRTGSTMLVQALDSHPNVTCFREIFNWYLPSIDFHVEGYEGSTEADLALRQRDPAAFLAERIFCQHPRDTSAVGFKLLYEHIWGFPGLLPHLQSDTALRVLRIRRSNLLRELVSLRLAETTGVWLQGGELPKLAPASFFRAFRHPFRALSGLRHRLRQPKPLPEDPRVAITVTPEELSNFIVQAKLRAARFTNLFRDHTQCTLFYEDMVSRREEVFRQAQEFLGLEPTTLTVSLRKQNPGSLRELIENYDDLHDAFKDTPHAAFFD